MRRIIGGMGLLMFLISGCASSQYSVEESDAFWKRYSDYRDKFYKVYSQDVSELKTYIGKSRDELAEVFSFDGKSMAGDETLDVYGNGITVYTSLSEYSDARLVFYLRNWKVYNVVKQ